MQLHAVTPNFRGEGTLFAKSSPGFPRKEMCYAHSTFKALHGVNGRKRNRSFQNALALGK